MENLNKLIKKFFTKEVIFYAIFGVLTTIVNISCFYVLTHFIRLEENLSNAISIIIAVLFAYFSNRTLVFNSNANSIKEKLLEFSKFVLGRAFTMLVEMLGFFLLFNVLNIQEIISKVLISIVVIVLNFFISKFFAFKK